jgi:hypothetical protein
MSDIEVVLPPPIEVTIEYGIEVPSYWGTILGSIGLQADLIALIATKIGREYFGSLTDYTNFKTNGHQQMVGDARPWRDELGDALSLRVQGNGLSINHVEGVAEFSNASNLSDYLYKNLQLNHDRDLTTVVYPHIHFFQEQAAMPNFLLQYRWQINGTNKVTPWTNLKCNTAVHTRVAGAQHQIANSVGIASPLGSAISDIIQFRILRDNANTSGVFAGADPYIGTVGVLSFDLHLQENSIGSDEPYVK